MSGNLAIDKPKSFGDDVMFDPNSTPNVKYGTSVTNIGLETKEIKPITTKTETITTKSPTIFPSCKVNSPPWPTILISIIGAVLLIVTAVVPNIDSNRRIFGIIFIFLWSLVWALILWVLWKECHRSTSWWLLLIPVAILAIFFILIIALHLG